MREEGDLATLVFYLHDKLDQARHMIVALGYQLLGQLLGGSCGNVVVLDFRGATPTRRLSLAFPVHKPLLAHAKRLGNRYDQCSTSAAPLLDGADGGRADPSFSGKVSLAEPSLCPGVSET